VLLLGRDNWNCFISFEHKVSKVKSPELGTLEWINFNPDFLIRISTVETFHFCPNPLLSLVARFSLIGCYSFSDDYCSVSYTFKIILQDYVNLEIIKKRGSNINPDIHHSKVFSSELKTLEWGILNPDLSINPEINNKRRTSHI